MEFKKVRDAVWQAEKEGSMNAPVRLYAIDELVPQVQTDRTMNQAKNVASLPGIVDAALLMPDAHEGYGFPIGGVAAFDLETGVISPGGVGYDINCTDGDTQVLMADGSVMKIKEMEKYFEKVSAGNGLILLQKVKAITVVTAKGKGEVTYFMKGFSKIFKIKTEEGREIKATADHPFLSTNGMAPLRKLCVGDLVATKDKIDSELVFERIIEIQPAGECEVYDITVENEHNFIANGFVVSNCGVRLLSTSLEDKEVRPKLQELINTLFKDIPSGVGSKGRLRLQGADLQDAVTIGSPYVIGKGFGVKKDAEHTEEGGGMKDADFSKVSGMAKKRGAPQFGTLGSGNHFFEVQRVEKIFAPETAKAFGVTHEGQVVVMLHCGSRGFGHQICDDYLRVMLQAAQKYNLPLPDRELAATFLKTQEAEDYLGAMRCAVNYAFCNRQVMTHWARESFASVFKRDWESMGLDVVYDVCHNIAKIEEHNGKKVCVHRKGATRAFWKGHKEVPAVYRNVGQPVIIPGSMNTASYLLCGLPGAAESFGTVCHGAGRVMSRHQAIHEFKDKVHAQLREKNIVYRSTEPDVLAEEAGGAYKNVDLVVQSVERAGLAQIVCKMIPLGVVKG